MTIFRARIAAFLLPFLTILAFSAAPAFAGSTAWWHLVSFSRPTAIHAGGEGKLMMIATNLGYGTLNAETTPVSISDALPAGFEAVAIAGNTHEFGVIEGGGGPVVCELGSLVCKFSNTLLPEQQIEVEVRVKVAAGTPSGEMNQFSVSGGEAPIATITRPVALGKPASFGVASYELTPEEAGGQPDTQAGSHPFQYTTTITLNETSSGAAVQLPKDLHFKQPTGFFGNPSQFTACTLQQFSNVSEGDKTECPLASVVGVAKVWVHGIGVAESFSVNGFVVPVYILEPSFGEPARFGFFVENTPVFLDTSVRTGGDYGITVNVLNLTQLISLQGSQVTIWGVPGDPRHDSERGFNCILGAREPVDASTDPCVGLGEQFPPPLLSMPTSCTGPLQSSVETDSWQEPAVLTGIGTSEAMPAQDGCNRLPFDPSIQVAPDGQAGSTPTGLTVGVHVPQDLDLAGEGLAEATVKNTTVTLPEGVTLAAGAADGLEACSLEQIGLETAAYPSCPDASKVATVSIATPLLPNPLVGAVYLAQQDANPFGSLVAMYIVAKDPVSGTLVKIAGKVELNPFTGQLVATFDNTPNLPFEDLKLHFFGGARAPLAMPALCGTYTTTASIEGWPSNPPQAATSSFQVDSGPNGSPCANPLPFVPTLAAGTTSIQAGGFTPFTMTMSREDGNQNLQGITLHMPEGLSGTLSTVQLCGEPQADAGTCGPESLIGHTTVSVGLGGDPYAVTGGQVFITGPYKGAPFGLSIVVPAKAGPYNFGTVVVRAKIEVDPITSALTITTDTTGPYKIPTILEGIPLEIKHVNVDIDRPGFTFNPTNCSPLKITGSLQSTEGATDNLSVPFQVTNCAVLSFKPHVSASTSGKTSRAGGASLHVNLSYTAGPYDTNIAKFKIALPSQLPSRLSTLQQACTAVVFNANPANCPAASMIGEARATTPLIPVPLDGPLYFVSHGGAQFPEVIVVLQGYGVTIDLHGETFISKAGVTSSTFSTVPDAPVGTFEATLPEGPNSALAANGSLCKSNLIMPTEIVAQNGAEFHQNTKIEATGCKVTKPTLKIVKHKTKGKKATVTVSVPSAGQLIANGSGLSKVSKHAGEAGNVTLQLALSSSERAFLAHHRGRMFAAHIKLRFTPTQGKALSGTTMVLLG